MSDVIAAPIFSTAELQGLADAATLYTQSREDQKEAALDFARILGDGCTYDRWEAARKAWITGYIVKKPLATDEAKNTAWHRFVRSLSEDAGFTAPTKPKKTEGAAPKMAAKRAAEKSIVAGKSRAQLEALQAELAAALTSPSPNIRAAAQQGLPVIIKALEAQDRAAEKAKAKAAKDETKGRRDTVTEYVKACPPAILQMFEWLIDATADNVPPEQQTNAVKHLVETMQPSKAAKAHRLAKAAKNVKPA